MESTWGANAQGRRPRPPPSSSSTARGYASHCRSARASNQPPRSRRWQPLTVAIAPISVLVHDVQQAYSVRSAPCRGFLPSPHDSSAGRTIGSLLWEIARLIRNPISQLLEKRGWSSSSDANDRVLADNIMPGGLYHAGLVETGDFVAPRLCWDIEPPWLAVFVAGRTDINV